MDSGIGEGLSDLQWPNINSIKPTMLLVTLWDHGSSERQSCALKRSRAVELVTAAISVSRVQAHIRSQPPIRDARGPPFEGDSLGTLQLNRAFK